MGYPHFSPWVICKGCAFVYNSRTLQRRGQDALEHPDPKPVYVLQECGPGEACQECPARGTISVHGVDTCLELLAQKNEREGTSIGVQVTTGEETPNLGVSYKDWKEQQQKAGLLETPKEGGG